MKFNNKLSFDKMNNTVLKRYYLELGWRLIPANLQSIFKCFDFKFPVDCGVEVDFADRYSNLNDFELK